MKWRAYTIIFLLLISFVAAAPGENVGVDQIFELMGHDKPADWSNWNKQQKFTYLQNLGVYPAKGGHYEGSIGSLSLYFSKLGLTQPDNWYNMTFEQRKEFIATSTEKITTNEKINTTNAPNTFEISFIIIAILISIASFFPFKNKFRKYSSFFTFYILPVILLLVCIFNPQRELFAMFGNIAEKLVIFLMFVKPISYIFSSKILTRNVIYRKELGVASFWFFIFHAGGLIYVRNLTSISNYSVPFLFWGLVAGLGMLLLGITSNNWSLRKLKKNWKRLQYIAYPVLLMILVHSGLFEQGNINKALIIGGLFIFLKFVEFKKVKIR